MEKKLKKFISSTVAFHDFQEAVNIANSLNCGIEISRFGKLANIEIDYEKAMALMMRVYEGVRSGKILAASVVKEGGAAAERAAGEGSVEDLRRLVRHDGHPWFVWVSRRRERFERRAVVAVLRSCGLNGEDPRTPSCSRFLAGERR